MHKISNIMVFIFSILASLLIFSSEISGAMQLTSLSSLHSNTRYLVGSVCSSYDGADAAPSATGDGTSLVVEYSARWTVQITGDKLVADSIAEKHGFINNGLVCSSFSTSHLLYNNYTFSAEW